MTPKESLRSKTISLRVTQADLEALQIATDSAHKPLAEWCRDAVLATLRQPGQVNMQERILAEIAALRTIVLLALGSPCDGARKPAPAQQESIQSTSTDSNVPPAAGDFQEWQRLERIGVNHLDFEELMRLRDLRKRHSASEG